MLLNVCCYSLHYTMSKLLSENYFIKETFQILCLGVFFTPYGYFNIRRTKQTPLFFCKQSLKSNCLLLIRVILAISTDVFPMIAFQNLRPSAVVTIMYTYPVWAILFGNLYFKKCFKLIDVFVSISCIGGVALIMKPFSESDEEDNILGFILSLAASISFGILPITNKLTQETFSSNYLIFCTGIASLLCSPCFYLVQEHNENFNIYSLSYLFLYGFSGVIGFGALILATAVGNIDKIISLEYLIIILNFITSIFVFGQEIDWYDCLGAALIIGSNVYKVSFVTETEEGADPPQAGLELEDEKDLIEVN